ncbi:hypothetical protein MMC11_001302 [Xylographa trunciseda]|nr:hypothetical protein [Xylographa trunciseda]
MSETYEAASTTHQVGDRSKDVPWYSAELEAVGPAARELLEEYSKIPPEEVVPHVLAIRDRAWQIWPYPCIGQFRFLDLSISLQPAYPRILARLRSTTPPTTLLDLGCCFGQDIRKLVHDGAPAAALYGAELRAGFLDMGYELFRDRGALAATFVQADVFAEGDADALRALDGAVDVVYTASFLHLFGWAEQVRVGKRIVRLLKGGKGGVVFGRQVGTLRPGEYRRTAEGGGSRYRHDGESFKRMWEQIGRETGTEWRVEVQMDEVTGWRNGSDQIDKDGKKWSDEHTRRLRFEVERI